MFNERYAHIQLTPLVGQNVPKVFIYLFIYFKFIKVAFIRANAPFAPLTSKKKGT